MTISDFVLWLSIAAASVGTLVAIAGFYALTTGSYRRYLAKRRQHDDHFEEVMNHIHRQ